MTDFVSYPHTRFTLPEGGKVTGELEAWFRGDGSVGVRTEGAHINDNNPAITYRGVDYLCHLEYTRQADGTMVETGTYRHLKRRDNYSDATPTATGFIMAAIADALADVWTPELEAAGLAADVAQCLHSLEREEREAADKLREVRKAIRAQNRRLR